MENKQYEMLAVSAYVLARDLNLGLILYGARVTTQLVDVYLNLKKIADNIQQAGEGNFKKDDYGQHMTDYMEGIDDMFDKKKHDIHSVYSIEDCEILAMLVHRIISWAQSNVPILSAEAICRPVQDCLLPTVPDEPVDYTIKDVRRFIKNINSEDLLKKKVDNILKNNEYLPDNVISKFVNVSIQVIEDGHKGVSGNMDEDSPYIAINYVNGRVHRLFEYQSLYGEFPGRFTTCIKSLENIDIEDVLEDSYIHPFSDERCFYKHTADVMYIMYEIISNEILRMALCKVFEIYLNPDMKKELK